MESAHADHVDKIKTELQVIRDYHSNSMTKQASEFHRECDHLKSKVDEMTRTQKEDNKDFTYKLALVSDHASMIQTSLDALTEVFDNLNEAQSAHREEAQTNDSQVRAKLGQIDEEISAGFKSVSEDIENIRGVTIPAVEETQASAHREFVDFVQTFEGFRVAVDRRMEQSDSAISSQLEKLHHIAKKEQILELIKEDVVVECHDTAASILGAFEKQCLSDLEFKIDKITECLHQAYIKLGLNPKGTLFSLSRLKKNSAKAIPLLDICSLQRLHDFHLNRFRDSVVQGSASTPTRPRGTPTRNRNMQF
jgi:vacuolar-type H+-ATPase subunit D/Vma8